jgi:hypothetical protein
MRFLLFIIAVMLLAFAMWPQQETPPIEDTFMGDLIVPLRKAEKFQQDDYNQGLDDYRARMDAQEAKGG